MMDKIKKEMNILNEVMQDYKIPDEQLFIHDNEPCPCGSGEYYMDCCKGKTDQYTIPSKKPLEVAMMERTRSELKMLKFCLHPDQANCKGQIKEAHALQNNKILSFLSGTDNHVMIQDHTRQPTILNEGSFVMIPFHVTSRNKATTQSCFCDYHDTVVFKPIEAGAPSFDPTNEEMKFIYAYKAFIFEYAKQFSLMKMMRHFFAERPQTFSARDRVCEYRVQTMRMNEMNMIKPFFDAEVLNGSHNGVYTQIVTIPHRIGFACYAYIGFDYDLNGNRIQLIDKENRMHRISVTVLPETTQSYILLSCLSSETKYFQDFFSQITNASLDKNLFYFNLMLPLYSENVVLSEDLWNRHTSIGQNALNFLANLKGNDHLNMSNAIAMMLRNASESNNTDYKNRGKIDLFQRIP